MPQGLELDDTALDEAEQAIGDGPVVMVNLLRFRDVPDYPAGFADAKESAQSGYYEGYVGGFRKTCEELGITPQLLFAGPRVHSLLAGPDDNWDEIAVVRYERFGDLRKILESSTYARLAKPHRFAVLADWRFIATRAR
ncbi:hypothetical protein [Frigidibacter oleivorans]|uniref:hypothetical protein n=1 Tax=Frigidibacter oleivorans TaxID=2487129 RepID=UPI000F8E7B81|nr:hypothetical protein [Frigidibacter oleivorans]